MNSWRLTQKLLLLFMTLSIFHLFQQYLLVEVTRWHQCFRFAFELAGMIKFGGLIWPSAHSERARSCWAAHFVVPHVAVDFVTERLSATSSANGRPGPRDCQNGTNNVLAIRTASHW